MNRQYTLEAIRTEGTSEWRTAPHDEFALVMDGEVQVRLMKLENPRGYTEPDDQGSVRSRTVIPTGLRWVSSRRSEATWRCFPPIAPTNSTPINPGSSCSRR